MAEHLGVENTPEKNSELHISGIEIYESSKKGSE